MAMERRRQCGYHIHSDLVPFAAIVLVDTINVGLNTLFKAVAATGISHLVLIVYASAIAVVVLLPATFMSYKSSALPPLRPAILVRIGIAGLIGSSIQILGYKGISFSSPTLSSAISNLTPALTFILAILFRMENLSLRRRSSQAKIIGTILSISGASVVTLYTGPRIVRGAKLSLLYSLGPPHLFSNSNWVIGGILLTSQSVMIALGYIVQAQIMKEYPAETIVIFFCYLCTCFSVAFVSLFTEHDTNAWRIRGLGLALVICTGIGLSLIGTVHTWGIRMKGPLYVAIFKPLSIVIALAMGVFFLGDALHLGSLIGVTIISIGFYTVMWGMARDEMNAELGETRTESLPSQKVPLLQDRLGQ